VKKTAAVLIIKRAKGDYLFLLRATKPHGLCFPGGKFDPEKDKDMADTAVRETREEIGWGFDKNDITFLGQLPSVDGTSVDIFYVEIGNIENVIINKAEHLAFHWLKDLDGRVGAGNTQKFFDLALNPKKKNGKKTKTVDPVEDGQKIDAVSDEVVQVEPEKTE
jgi:8-oxo-dGTP pyrophosphatase MutT (NUDIX family)